MGEHLILSVTEKPVKSLGKVLNCSLNDRDSIHATSVGKSGLPVSSKAWIYQHGILPWILWPLLIYKAPMAVVEGFEQRVSSYSIFTDAGLPCSLNSIWLYGSTNKLKLLLGLPGKSLSWHGHDDTCSTWDPKTANCQELWWERECRSCPPSWNSSEAQAFLCTWGIKTPPCTLCSNIGTLGHISCNCHTNNQVLKSIAEAIRKGIKNSRCTQATSKTILFVKEEQKPEKTPNNCSIGLFYSPRLSNDSWPWEAAEGFNIYHPVSGTEDKRGTRLVCSRTRYMPVEVGQSGSCQPLPEQGLRLTGHNRCQAKRTMNKSWGCWVNIQMTLAVEGRAVGAVEFHLAHRSGSAQPWAGHRDKSVCCETQSIQWLQETTLMMCPR